MKNSPFLILFLIFSSKIHGQTSSVPQQDIFEQFRIAIVGTWHPEGQGGAEHQVNTVFDTVLYNSLPFKAHDTIGFYENGFFRVNGSEALNRYEIDTIAVQSFDSDEGELWIFQIKLDGFEYYAIFRFFNKSALSLGYNYGTGSWSQPLIKE